MSGLNKIEGTDFLDIGLCHGTSSIALLYRKIFWLTQEKKFNEAYNYWLSLTSNQLMKQLDNFDLMPSRVEKVENVLYIRNYGILEGITGALILFLSDEYRNITEWEELFLLRS